MAGAHVSAQTAHNLKHGIGEPHASTKQKVAEFFKLTVEQLFDDGIQLPNTKDEGTRQEIETLKISLLYEKGRVLQLEKEIVSLESTVKAQKEEINRLYSALGKASDAGLTARTTQPGKTKGSRHAGVIS